METYNVVETPLTAAAVGLWRTEPGTVFQTLWPYSPSYVVGNYKGVAVPHVIPHVYNPVIQKPSLNESRKFFLNRSAFDLVDAHRCLSLTDPELLGWYLHLSPEDRKLIQDEGGFHQFLQRHPALKVSRQHVYVKYNFESTSPGQPSVTSNKHKSRMSEALTHRCDMEMLHNVSEALDLLACSRNGSQKCQCEEICHTDQLVHLPDRFQTAFNSPITPLPNHQKAHKVKQLSGSPLPQLKEQKPSWQMDSSSSSAVVSFSVDMELERHREGQKPEFRSQTALTEGQSAKFTYAEVSPLQSEWPESPSVDTVHDEASLSFGDQSDNFYSIMEEDKSILACLPSEDVKVHNSGVQSGPVTANSETLAANSETLKSDQSVIKRNTAEKSTSPMPPFNTCDNMVGTEPALCTSAVTQTEDPGTSDKHVITEVHMADLDYIAEELMKLKMANEEMREQKEKMKSSGCKLRKECDCIQRAQQAELCLLALQYSMCRQHCWRLYYTSAEEGQLNPLSKKPPADFVSVLQKLESDYDQMRNKVLAGVPLKQLKPLSVDSEKITTGASYIPAQIICDVLGNVPSWISQEPHRTPDEGSPNNQIRNGCQRSERKEQIKKNSTARRAVTFVPQNRDAIHNENKPEEKKTTATCKEFNISEAWYDAEEDLEPAAAAEARQDPTVITKDKTDESTSEEAKISVLCVSNLSSNVTESDVMLWFEKYQASEVSISALKNDLRVAIVMISGPQSAEAAVRELNGCSRQGRTLHVEHINRASISGPESSQDTIKPQTSKTESSSTERKLITQPLLSPSIKMRKVVSISPTAKGTCVPQHYGTMGSFDTLMTELMERHPNVTRQRIVDALIELKAKHQGVLSGLPLRTIRDMTSELLTRPASTTQL